MGETVLVWGLGYLGCSVLVTLFLGRWLRSRTRLAERPHAISPDALEATGHQQARGERCGRAQCPYCPSERRPAPPRGRGRADRTLRSTAE